MGNARLGRPRLLSPIASRFCDLYFDPLWSAGAICQRLSISRATFYRYEAELAAPKVRVGFGSIEALPKLCFARHLKSGPTAYDLAFLRHICQCLGLRAKLVIDDPQRIIRRTTNGEFDFSIASVSKTTARNASLHFSTNYVPSLSPNGQIYLSHPQELATDELLQLAVVRGTIHHEYALKNLANRFRIVEFSNHTELVDCFSAGMVRASLMYSGFASYLREKRPQTNTVGPINYYNSFTGICFALGKDQWLPDINRAIDTILSNEMISDRVYLFA